MCERSRHPSCTASGHTTSAATARTAAATATAGGGGGGGNRGGTSSGGIGINSRSARSGASGGGRRSSAIANGATTMNRRSSAGAATNTHTATRSSQNNGTGTTAGRRRSRAEAAAECDAEQHGGCCDYEHMHMPNYDDNNADVGTNAPQQKQKHQHQLAEAAAPLLATMRTSLLHAAGIVVGRSSAIGTFLFSNANGLLSTTDFSQSQQQQQGGSIGIGVTGMVTITRMTGSRASGRTRSNPDDRDRIKNRNRKSRRLTGTVLGLLSLACLSCLLVSYGGDSYMRTDGGRIGGVGISGGVGDEHTYMAMYAAGRAPLANLQSAQDLHQRLAGLRGRRRLRQVSQGDEEVQMRRYDRSHHKSNHLHHRHDGLYHKNQQFLKKNKTNKKNYQLSDRHRYLAEALEGSSPPDSIAVGDAAETTTTTAKVAALDREMVPATDVVPTPPIFITQPYNTEQVLATQQMFENHHKAALLIFDGSRSAIECYIPDGPDLEGPSKRYWPAFLLARALYHHFPARFAPGSPPFQLLYTTGDYPHLNCLGTDGGCGFVGIGDGNGNAGGEGGTATPLAPILSFGSVPRDPTVLPTATAMPFPSMAECLVRDCRLLAQNALERGDASAQQWSELRPQILWRGNDYTTFADNFDLGLQHGVDLGIEPNTMTTEEVADRLIELWDTLTPSWRAVASSLRARIDADRAATEDVAADGLGPQPWIDAKFTMGHSPAYKLYDTKFAPFLDAGSEVATAEYMGADEMASYRYHIDIVTGGATSWEDTVLKLALPGLLFHHESLMKDWFYDELKAWEHYVPVRMDLSDLSEKYVWAEQHPLEAQTIAQNGRNFVRTMAMEGWKKETYQKLFVNKLGEIVSSYVPNANMETLESILGSHELSGIRYNLYSRCTSEACAVSNKDTRTFGDVQFDFLKDYSWMGVANAEAASTR